MLGMLECLVNGKLDAEFPLFDIFWNHKPSNPEGFLDEVTPHSAEESTVLGKNRESLTIYRVQNFFMNLSYRSLLYYYSEKRMNFEEKEVMVHFTGDKAFKSAEKFVAIEDMSYFMVEILKHDVQEYKKNQLAKNTKSASGCVVIMKHLHFPENDYTVIPAYLPIYLVQLNSEKKKHKNDEDEEEIIT